MLVVPIFLLFSWTLSDSKYLLARMLAYEMSRVRSSELIDGRFGIDELRSFTFSDLFHRYTLGNSCQEVHNVLALMISVFLNGLELSNLTDHVGLGYST